MKSKACLDTGVITLFYSENPPNSINDLLVYIEKGTTEAYTLFPLLVEAFFQICKLEGKDSATRKISNFTNEYPINVMPLDLNLSIKAGLLRCQHRKLSHNNCIAVAFCLNNKIPLHTTEKKLKELIPHLSLRTYPF